MPEGLSLERPEPTIGLLTLTRSERKNALSIALRDEMSVALDDLASDEALKAVVVTGAGDTFSAGFDLGEFETAFADEAYAARLWESSDRWHRRVLRFPLPTIAAVNGPALGGGFDLAVMCDVRVASTTARFAHPEYAFGDVVYTPLHDIVGGATARELCLTGRSVDATEALTMRLVSQIVDQGSVVEHALETARRIAVAPRANLMRTKAKAARLAGNDVDAATLDL